MGETNLLEASGFRVSHGHKQVDVQLGTGCRALDCYGRTQRVHEHAFGLQEASILPWSLGVADTEREGCHTPSCAHGGHC